MDQDKAPDSRTPRANAKSGANTNSILKGFSGGSSRSTSCLRGRVNLGCVDLHAVGVLGTGNDGLGFDLFDLASRAGTTDESVRGRSVVKRLQIRVDRVGDGEGEGSAGES